MQVSTVDFRVKCFCTDTNAVISWWQEAAKHIGAVMDYKKGGLIRKHVDITLSFKHRPDNIVGFDVMLKKFEKEVINPSQVTGLPWVLLLTEGIGIIAIICHMFKLFIKG